MSMKRQSSCSVCLHPPEHPFKLACDHVFCRDCVKSSLKLSSLCPFCKKEAQPLTELQKTETVAGIEIEIEKLQEKKRHLLQSKERETKKMALDFFVECTNQKVEKIDKLKKDLAVLNNECETAESCHSPHVTRNYANMLKNFTDLENNYFSSKASNSKYKKIGKVIYEAFKYDTVKSLGKLCVNGSEAASSYIHDMTINSRNLLAVAGSLDTINIYNYLSIESNPLPILYPVTKIPSKCSTWATAWNTSSPNLLAASDFHSDIKIWDVTAGVSINCFQGHTAAKYLSIGFSPTRPQQLVSGGFDGCVKLWRINEQACSLTIRSPDKLLKLCCKPQSAYHLAASSIDKSIYCYDIRKPDKPVTSLLGHAKSVSQLKFLDARTLVSASVDGTLKQWDYDSGQCTRTYHGHINTSKFIGLDVQENHIACGSENNSLVLYHEALSKPVLFHKFPASASLLGNPVGDQDTRHLTAIAWRGGQVCVANDQGLIHLLRLEEFSGNKCTRDS